MDCDIDRIRDSDLMKFLSEEDAESLYSAGYMRVIDPSESYDPRGKFRLDERAMRR